MQFSRATDTEYAGTVANIVCRYYCYIFEPLHAYPVWIHCCKRPNYDFALYNTR